MSKYNTSFSIRTKIFSPRGNTPWVKTGKLHKLLFFIKPLFKRKVFLYTIKWLYLRSRDVKDVRRKERKKHEFI